MVSATVLVTLAINASDNVNNLSASLVGTLLHQSASNSRCPKGMVLVSGASNDFCIDIYEASPDSVCPFDDPQNQAETKADLDAPDCRPASVAGSHPWVDISQNQAAEACAKAGKRLPTNKEWYEAALGTPDPGEKPNDANCYVGKKGVGRPALTGNRDLCVSAAGVSDMIGNVWEWVDATVYDGVLNGHHIPAAGYVTSADQEGIAVETSPDKPDDNYGDDYFWNDPVGTHGVFRGGFWGIGTEAGVYAVHAIVSPSFTGSAVGFRCVK